MLLCGLGMIEDQKRIKFGDPFEKIGCFSTCPPFFRLDKKG
jgi:hypothetical protein